MAKAKLTGKDGIDRWTSNGYGIFLSKEDTKKNDEDKKTLNDGFRRMVMTDDDIKK